MENSKRQFLKTASLSTILFLNSSFAFCKILQEESDSYKTPRNREDLYYIPEKDLLARMIFGEARNCPTTEEKIIIGQTALNRINDGKKYNGEGSLKEVLLKRTISRGEYYHQYECFSDTSLKTKRNFYATLNPLKYDSGKWEESKEITKFLLKNEFDHINKRQTIYITKNRIKKWNTRKKHPGWYKRSIAIEDISDNEDKFLHKFYREI